MPAPLVLTQHVPADPQRVYRAWTDPAELARWWWPQWPDTTYEVDARAGGAYRIRSASVGVGVHGVFTALDEPTRIEMTWVWESDDGPAPPDRVGVELVDEDGGGTLVTVTHAMTGADDGSDYVQGWTDVLARLGQRVPGAP